ncbi:MAG TPA: porin [Usitatibacter sp.]|nr:porin [Usitatibacter sp.]
MAATEKERASPLQALMTAALALPIAAIPARAVAAEANEMGFTVLGYKEQGLMKVTEPVLWARGTIHEVWEVEASAALDIISGASPQLVTNVSGRPVNAVSAASITDRRNTADAKVTRRFGDFAVSVSRTVSDENDYNSRAFGLGAEWSLDQRNTTLAAGYGKSDDRVGSRDDPTLHERRDTREYLVGITQVLSPLDIVQSTVTRAEGRGWYNDPYKLTFTFFDSGIPLLLPDTRPDHRDTLAWLTRYRRHFPAAHGSLQVDYRYYRDDWGIRAHTLEAAWEQSLGERWSVRPALRYYTQSAADFYSPVSPSSTPPAILSSDQRLGAWGGLSPSLRVAYRFERGIRFEGTLGYVHNARELRFGGSGSEAFETLRAVYGIVGVSYPF